MEDGLWLLMGVGAFLLGWLTNAATPDVWRWIKTRLHPPPLEVPESGRDPLIAPAVKALSEKRFTRGWFDLRERRTREAEGFVAVTVPGGLWQRPREITRNVPDRIGNRERPGLRIEQILMARPQQP